MDGGEDFAGNPLAECPLARLCSGFFTDSPVNGRDKLGSEFARAFMRHRDKLSVSLVNGPWRSTS